MQTNQPNRAKRFRIIVFATIIAFIVVIFGAWIITSAIKSAEKSRQQEITATEESKEEKTNKTEAKSSEKTNNQGQTNKIPTTSPADQYQNNKSTSTSNATSTTKAASDLPSTGPEDLVFTAILAGVAVYLVCLNLNHKKSVA